MSRHGGGDGVHKECCEERMKWRFLCPSFGFAMNNVARRRRSICVLISTSNNVKEMFIEWTRRREQRIFHHHGVYMWVMV